MISEVTIRGLGVISEAVLELGPGLIVLTGETGAGKTMVMSGLGLLLGGRADAGLVRAEAGRCFVEGRFRVDPDGPAAAAVAEAGGELEDGDGLLLTRTVGSDGRSRCWLGGTGVPAGRLAELGADLVAVHGQGDQHGLARPGRARDCLDRFAGPEAAELLAAYRGCHRELAAVRRQLSERTERAEDRAREAEDLRDRLAEFTEIAAAPGEDAALAGELTRLSHAAELGTAARQAQSTLLGDPAEHDGPDAAGLLGRARDTLARAGALDPALHKLGERIAEAGYLLADVGTELASYVAGLECDPARLAAANERHAALARLCRRHGAGLAEVFEWAARAGARLVDLDADADTGAELTERVAGLEAQLVRHAEVLRAVRLAAAARLAGAVETELAELALPAARFHVTVSSTRPGPDGADEVEFTLSPHPGAPARPVQRAASGGELSRIMLALQVVLVGSDEIGTFVFDEVDAGIGGRAAIEVGARLARLAADRQVLVVTHLAQVAAFADRHLLVEKNSDGAVTRADVSTLSEQARLRELSRMLSGHADSATARAHAAELRAAAVARITQAYCGR